MATKIPAHTLSEAERTAARARAARIRAERAALRRALKSGELTFRELFRMADEGDRAAAGIRASQLLSALPGIGERKTQHIMHTVRIADTRKVGGIGPRQREKLLDLMEHGKR